MVRAAFGVLVASGAVVVSAASADTFCVAPATGCDPPHSTATVAAALSAATMNGVENAIQLGAATYSENALVYSGVGALTIQGVGAATTIQRATPADDAAALRITSPAHVTIQDLRIHVSGPARGPFGVYVDSGGGGGDLRGLTIDSDSLPSSPTGVDVASDDWTLSGSVIDMQGRGPCLYSTGSDELFTDTTLRNCSLGLVGQGGSFLAQRLRIISGGSYGVDVGSGQAVIEDSLITGNTTSGVAVIVGSGSPSLLSRQNTVVGTNSGGAAQCSNNQTGGGGTLTVVDSILGGTNSLRAAAPNGGTCTVNVDYSDYTGSTSQSGGGTVNISALPGHAITSDPLFIDPSHGNYRLAASSPAKDFDSTALVAGESSTDLDGGLRRINNGKRDLGAYERPLPGSAQTGPPGAITRTTAALTGTVNTGGGAGTWKLAYGPTTAYGSQTSDTALNAVLLSQPVGSTLSGLVAGVTYHYQVVVSTPYGPITSPDATFTTLLPDPPTMITGQATGVAETGATLLGTVNPHSGLLSDCHFEYGASALDGASVPCREAVAPLSSPVAVSAVISGLAPGTTYHVRLVGTNAGGTTSGAETSFTTTTTYPPVADTATPSVVIRTPASGATLTNTPVTVTGIATDNVRISSLTVNGRAVTVSATGTWRTSVALIPGSNTITAVASDPAGNRGQTRITVTYLVAQVAIAGRPSSTGTSVRVPLSCKARGADCPGTITVKYTERFRIKVHGQTTTRTITWRLGSAHYSIRSGRRLTVAVRMNQQCKKLMRKTRRLKTTIVITLTQPNGRTAGAAQASLTLTRR